MGHALIVEDDADSARMMAALVGAEGFSAATARSLHDARRQMAMQQPDLVLLDLRLPDGNGMSLLDEQELIGNSEVVLMTGHATLETSIQALRYGAADYLIKPVSARQLQSILSRVTRPSVLRAEVDSLNEDLQRSGPLRPPGRPLRADAAGVRADRAGGRHLGHRVHHRARAAPARNWWHARCTT